MIDDKQSGVIYSANYPNGEASSNCTWVVKPNNSFLNATDMKTIDVCISIYLNAIVIVYNEFLQILSYFTKEQFNNNAEYKTKNKLS